MMLLSRCCCCFHLKYGYFAYGILSMTARLMACFSLYFYASGISFDHQTATSENTAAQMSMYQAMSFYGAWVITAIVSLFLTLKGIVQKRSILIYPYIVVLSVELCGVIITCIILTMVATAFFLLVLPLAGGIYGYELWCLISLYKEMKYKEQMRYMGVSEGLPMKAV